MSKLIVRLGMLLSQIKGFDTAYSTSSKGKMLLDFEGERYLLEVKKISSNKNYFEEDYDKYIKNK